MAYKGSYSIPNSLDKSMLDQEIALSKSAHVQPFPIKVVLFYLASLLILFWVVSSTFIRDSSLTIIVLLVMWWLLATVYFGRYSKTKELRFSGIPALLSYLPRVSRRVLTRRSSNASGFYSIAGVKDVDDDGRVAFSDGTVGRAYLVVGSASVLVFEADKRAIVNRVDSFYRKVEHSVEFICLTTKEPQRVDRALANLERRNLVLEVRDPELFALLDEQAEILVEHVGTRFSSIHQYLVIKADNDEALRRGHALLQAEVEDSSLMIKSCMVLDRPGFLEMGKTLFSNAS
ncbi:hypothetical protein [Arthrobacter bambusae]|uniref:PrgI family protein n=1 Tax=Arthrobacter bambusae TaxID=1338426 RepID=A0AAW8DA87_9MICC|nr:hypothetical protein [Arthrobacter bambusae]MDP9903210.1 hypothetical protein [Arthrobacter bambusae]MDQ0128796.1 hypothetical protein [Arthrobacter bambusae]MDQ0180137.1 hypothetical protein [Arthrobacter bambusae]